MGAVMKIKEARAKAIAEGATPESVGATHKDALPLKPEEIVVPRAKLCPQMDPRGAAPCFNPFRYRRALLGFRREPLLGYWQACWLSQARMPVWRST